MKLLLDEMYAGKEYFETLGYSVITVQAGLNLPKIGMLLIMLKK